MPRDINGTYSLPLPDVNSGEAISSAWANTTMSDIETALTQSLSRNGQGGMLAALTFGDGIVTEPGIAFSLEPGSGLYRAGSKDVRMAITTEGDTMRWLNGIVYVRNAADTAWASVVYTGGAGSVPNGTVTGDGLVWNNATSLWERVAAPAGGTLPAGSATNDLLQWNGTAWVSAAVEEATSNINDGTVAGQTAVWDGSVWTPNNLLKLDVGNDSVGIGASMAAPSSVGVRLAVLNKVWVGNVAGTLGLNLAQVSGTMYVSAGTFGTTVGTLPIAIDGSTVALTSTVGDVAITADDGITYNAVTTSHTFRCGGFDMVTIGSAGRVNINDPLFQAFRLQVKADAADAGIVRIKSSAGDVYLDILDNGWIKMVNLPTSASGLPSGTLYNSAGTLKIA